MEIYRARRQLEHKDFEYELERQRYTQAIHQKMNVVAVEERRRLQREAKLSEAHLLRFQNEQKNAGVPIAPLNQHKRIEQMKEVISLMQENVQIQERVASTVRDIPIALPVKDTRSKEAEQLDKLEHKLIRMMIEQPPQPVLAHLVQPLAPSQPSKEPELMKTMMNVEMLQGIRNISKLEFENQQKKWENELAKVYQKTRGDYR